MNTYSHIRKNKEIDNILVASNLKIDTIVGIHTLVNDVKGVDKLLLEYLKSNNLILEDKKIDPLDKGSIIFNHIVRIYQYLGVKCCFPIIYDYVDNEIIPPFTEKKNRNVAGI